MTLRLVLGVDPGQTGAIAVLADGEFRGASDMPTMPRRAGGNEIDCVSLAVSLRATLAMHPGAYHIAVVEAVSAMPKQGVSSVFRFGESFGAIKGILGALRVPTVLVPAATWKRHLGLWGAEKDVARSVAIQRFPDAAAVLQRKKDVGRADALLIAHWAELTEAVGPARAAA